MFILIKGIYKMLYKWDFFVLQVINIIMK
jgi:hypothetical protein